MEQRERDYLARREADCRRMAAVARDARIRGIHEELADHYAQRLDALPGRRPEGLCLHFAG